MKLKFWEKDPEQELRLLRFDLDKVDLSESETLKLEKRLMELCPDDVRVAHLRVAHQQQPQHQQQPCGIASTMPSMPSFAGYKHGTHEAGPLDDGRLVEREGGMMYWMTKKGGEMEQAEKPSFKWDEKKQELQLLPKPTQERVAGLFDVAHEKGLGMPQIRIFGTPEFQMLAAQEAARRGIPIDTAGLNEQAREAYIQAWDQHHGDAANALVSAAYESADADEEHRRPKADVPANADRERDSQEERRRQQMRM